MLLLYALGLWASIHLILSLSRHAMLWMKFRSTTWIIIVNCKTHPSRRQSLQWQNGSNDVMQIFTKKPQYNLLCVDVEHWFRLWLCFSCEFIWQMKDTEAVLFTETFKQIWLKYSLNIIVEVNACLHISFPPQPKIYSLHRLYRACL